MKAKLRNCRTSNMVTPLAIGLALFTLIVTATGQISDTRNNADKTTRSSARINPTTLGMEFSLPLGTVAGRVGSSLPITFNYSSKVWRLDIYNDLPSGTQFADPTYGEHSNSGWTSSPQLPFFEDTSVVKFDTTIGHEDNCPYFGAPGCIFFPLPTPSPVPTPTPSGGTFLCTPYERSDEECTCEFIGQGQIFYYNCHPIPNTAGTNGRAYTIIPKITVHFPDGSTRDLVYSSDGVNPGVIHVNQGQNFPIITHYVSLDGSNETLDTDNDTGRPHVFRMPDGSHYDFVYLSETDGYTVYVDRNGNKMTARYNPSSLQTEWHDTMGRTFPFPQLPTAPADFSYSMRGLNGAPALNYVFKWKSLGDSFVPGSGYTVKHYGDLFTNPWNATELNNPTVLAEVVLPNGQSYKFGYNELGEIEKITNPNGSTERFAYAAIPQFSYPIKQTDNVIQGQGNRGVTDHWISEDGTTASEMHWQYSVPLDPANPSSLRPAIPYRVVSTAPDSSYTERFLFVEPIPPSSQTIRLPSQLAGRVYEEKAYSSASNHPMVRHTLTKWSVSNGTLPGGYPTSYLNEYPKVDQTTDIMIEGDQALAQSKTFTYDSHLNVTSQTLYDDVPLSSAAAQAATIDGNGISVSAGNSLKTTQTTYVTDSNYTGQQMVSLPQTTIVRDGDFNGQIISLSETVYDNYTNSNDPPHYPASNPVLTYSGIESSLNCGTTTDPVDCWDAPATPYRGNPTTSRVWRAEDSSWIETHTQFDQFGNPRKAWDASGDSGRFAETQYSADYKYAYPTSVTAPGPDPTNTRGTNETSTVTTSYDLNTGLPLSVTDAFGQVTTTDYDALLRPVQVNPVVVGGSATGPISQTIYNDTPGNLYVTVKKQLDAVNWDEATTYMDGLGRKVKTVAKDAQGDITVETHYDAFGRVDRVTSPYRAGDTVYWSKTRFDDQGRAVETYAPATIADINSNNLVSLGVTSFGISTVNDGNGNQIGTVVTTTDASGRKGRSITNALGQLVRVDEPVGISSSADTDLGTLSAPAQPTYYTYDAFGKMVKVKQGGQYRYFKYDSLGRLLRILQPEQEVNTSLNLSDSYNTSGGWSAGFTYDVLGNVLTATDANGVTITNTYDGANRVTTRSYSDGTTPTVNFYYDGKGLDAPQTPNYAKGKLTKVTSTVSETRNTQFDNFGRLTETKQITDGQTYTSSYQYNLSGALVQETYPSGRVVKNDFATDGDLTKVTSQKNSTDVFRPFVSDFSYNASGGISQMKLGNGKWETAKFNTRQQVTELGLGASATDAGLWKVDYDYGELQSDGTTVDEARNTGNIAKQTLTIPGASFIQAYKYDPLYRLTNAQETPSGSTAANWAQSWTYDRYGNRQAFSQNLAGNTSAPNPTVVAATNRFALGQGFVYDKNGNITQDVDAVTAQSRTFVFNGDNKQTQVKDANGNAVGTYFYDGEGKRVKKVTDTETTVFVYSSGKLVAEYSTQLSTTPTISYTTTDHLGTPRIITDQFGQVKSRRDFMPFGEEISTGTGSRSSSLGYEATSDSVRQKFTGYQKDSETSLDFAEARMYENRFARFTAVDPLLASGKSADPQSFNRYVYVRNSPLAGTDPSGRSPEWVYDDNAQKGTENPVWVPHSEFIKGGYREWERTVYTTAAGDHIVLNRDGPLTIDADDVFKGWSKNGVTQGTGVFALPSVTNEFISNLFTAQLKAVPNVAIDFLNLGIKGSYMAQGGIPLFVPQIPRIEYPNLTQKFVGYPTEFGLNMAITAGAGEAAEAISISSKATTFDRGLFSVVSDSTSTASAPVHGNSLSSLRPTWGYRLFSEDGTFLKNGITSQPVPEARYTKAFMSDKKMFTDATPFFNRLAARNWERLQNTLNPGPLNIRR